MVWFLFDDFGIVVDRTTICRLLAKRKWSRKLAKRKAAQQSDTLRKECKLRLAGWTVDQLAFLNESAACERTGEWPASTISSLYADSAVGDRK